jgi:hypothetical protein
MEEVEGRWNKKEEIRGKDYEKEEVDALTHKSNPKSKAASRRHCVLPLYVLVLRLESWNLFRGS